MKKNELTCADEKTSIFSLLKLGEYEEVVRLIFNNEINVNMIDGVGNDIVTRLLKAKQYDLVIEVMKKRNWDVNHQNEEGNTFGHILAQDDSAMAVKVMEQLTKKKNYLPNIKNNRGETAMDIALSNHYLCTAFKILEDKRFDNIDIFSFKNLLRVTIKSKFYGKYSKIMNLDIIVSNLEKKNLDIKVRELVENIRRNMETIKSEIMNNSLFLLETIVNYQAIVE